MKIGIVTQPLHNNYGGLLQNYAFQQVLKRMGHEPITLRSGTALLSYSKWNYQAHYCLWLVKYYIYKLLGYYLEKPITQKQYSYDSAGMNDFIVRNINCTLPRLRHKSKDILELKLDALIVGSDQVWRPRYNADIMNFQFLGFAKGMDIIRISYAASFGTNKWEFTNSETLEAGRLLQRFDAISVREESAVIMCREHFGVDAIWVLDPTMLLNIDDYLFLCKDVTPVLERYVFAYILDDDGNKKEQVESYAKMLGCGVIFVDDKHTKHNDSVEQWLAYIRDATYVITDSFHGTVFSILFHKQFLCLNNEKRGSSRMESLKKISGLNNRFTPEVSKLPFDKIEYDNIEKKINEMRSMSLAFLHNSLNRSSFKNE